MFKKACILVMLLSCILTLRAQAQEDEEIVFSGVPVVKISEGGIDRTVENLRGSLASEEKCTIIKFGDTYLWKSRNNIELALVQNNVFLTFIAINGTGYVRIIPPDSKKAASLDKTEKRYDYVEHILIGLRSVTYYGKSK